MTTRPTGQQLAASAIFATAVLAAQCASGDNSAFRSGPVAPPVIIVSIPVQGVDTSGASIAVDGEGGVWIIAAPDYAVHRMDVKTGDVMNYPLPRNAEAHGAVINDHALWLADYTNSELLRYDSTGAMKAYRVGAGIFPYGLMYGDGKFWFVEATKQSIGVMTPDGSVSAIPVPMPSWLGGPMARDDDHTLWVGGPPGRGDVGYLGGDGSFRLFEVRGQLVRLFACPNGSVAFAAVDGMGSPWIERIGLMDREGKEQHADYIPPSPAPTSAPMRGIVAVPHGQLVGPPPPPSIQFFACDAGGAWFVIDRAVIGHVDANGRAEYFFANVLTQSQPAAPSPERTAWIALDDRIVEISY